MYCIGDLGCWLQDGLVEYLDWVDNQVKICGFRIELGEIEFVFFVILGVCENVVVVCDDLFGGKVIVVYVVVMYQVGDFDLVVLCVLLCEKLFDFMVFVVFVVMESLLFILVGKID